MEAYRDVNIYEDKMNEYTKNNISFSKLYLIDIIDKMMTMCLHGATSPLNRRGDHNAIGWMIAKTYLRMIYIFTANSIL